jgi:anti-sigma factor RsiW
MTLDIQLKLQAYLDGELPSGEVRAVEDLLASSDEARALLGELRHTRTAVRGSELPAKLAETREFYWSQIARRIEADEVRAAAQKKRHSLLGWRQLVATLAGAAAVFVLIFNTAKPGIKPMASIADDVETSNNDVEAYTYHDSQANMTVVWLQARPASFTTASGDDSIQHQ